MSRGVDDVDFLILIKYGSIFGKNRDTTLTLNIVGVHDTLGNLLIQKVNEEKAALLYDFIDNSKLFKSTVAKEDRSIMNIPFVTGDLDLDAKFVKEATAEGLCTLKGHKLVGGMRASIYNAMPIEGVKKLVEFMAKFERENG